MASDTASKQKALPVVWTKIRGVIFDIDGTMVNSGQPHYEALSEVLAEARYKDGKRITKAEFYNDGMSGADTHSLMDRFFPDMEDEKKHAFAEKKEALFREKGAKELKEVTGLSNFLDLLKEQGLSVVLVTNAPEDKTKFLLHSIGRDELFSKTVLGQKLERSKPAPEPYAVGLEKLGMQASEVLVFEDSPSGIKSAVSAGLPVVVIESGSDSQQMLDAGAAMVVKDYHEVVDMIKLQEATSDAP